MYKICLDDIVKMVKKISGGGLADNSWIFNSTIMFWILIVVLIFIAMLLYMNWIEIRQQYNNSGGILRMEKNNRDNDGSCNSLDCVGVRRGMTNPYVPPLKEDNVLQSRGGDSDYSQMGILTKDNGAVALEPKILPLMGRRHSGGRDKWQYYTISNSGTVNTKLPVRANGRACLTERGCDEIMNGDIIFVEGYNDGFKATVYENCMFRYLPSL